MTTLSAFASFKNDQISQLYKVSNKIEKNFDNSDKIENKKMKGNINENNNDIDDDEEECLSQLLDNSPPKSRDDLLLDPNSKDIF